MSPENHQGHYRRILKSSSLIGGSSFIKVLIDMVRAKFAAVYLGTSGVGLLGIYQSLVGMASVVSGMGMHTSGVREIAAANGAGDDDKVARTVVSIRRAVWITGTLGLFVLVLGSTGWSRFSFDNLDHSLAIASLGTIILLAAIAMGQSCILQGTQRIADLARIGILGASLGTLTAVPCYYFLRQNGIVPSMILAAVATLVTTWLFARRVPLKKIPVPWRESRTAIFQLFSFGFPVMLGGFMSMLALYLIRVLLIRQVGQDGVGIYHAAFALSGVLVNFVLQAMGSDYYPRLIKASKDNRQMGIEINTQTEIALLLALPLLGATIIFAPLAINIFYSGEFDASVGILRWFVFGIFGRLVSWPMGYVILAKGKGKTFFCVELTANMLHIILVWLCINHWGLIGTGIAFMMIYIFYTILTLIVCFSLTRETWTQFNLLQIIIFGCILIILRLNCELNALFLARWSISIIILTLLSVYCLRRLSHKTGITFSSLQERFMLRVK